MKRRASAASRLSRLQQPLWHQLAQPLGRRDLLSLNLDDVTRLRARQLGPLRFDINSSVTTCDVKRTGRGAGNRRLSFIQIRGEEVSAKRGFAQAGARGATSWWSNEMVGGPEIDVSFVQIQAGEVSATELGAQVGGRGVDGVGGGVARQS